MTRITSGALLALSAAVVGVAAAAFIDPNPHRLSAREIADLRIAPEPASDSVAQPELGARVGAALLLGLEWSRR